MPAFARHYPDVHNYCVSGNTSVSVIQRGLLVYILAIFLSLMTSADWLW